ncbi:MAG: hypothetical protein QM741_00400 [Rudaea sp.]|uniref:hypothetical protein n=1 Tax=Rudaea sp. TaxID=2136325 RepID=UPI0039E34A4A
MNTSTPLIRLGLLALTGAVVLGATALESRPVSHPATATRPTVTLGTVTVRPDVVENVAAQPVAPALSVLPTVHVYASEEEALAARLDPSDRIQVFAPIVVQPDAEEVAAALRATAVVQVGDDDEHGLLVRAVAEPHRLRLDMPYYSFGKVLTHGK